MGGGIGSRSALFLSIMSDTNEVPVAAAKAPSSPVIPLILAMVMVVGGSVGGAMYWLVKSGRLPVAGAPVVVQAAKAEEVKTRMIALEPLLANLTDQGGAGYLRVVMVLRVQDLPAPKDAKPKEEKPAEKGKVVVNDDDTMLRDAALTVVGRETSASLLAPEGKEHLKQELRTEFAAHVPTVKVVDVMFTEFLVQR